MERTERMISILEEDWDNIILIASRYDGSATDSFKVLKGNRFAVEKMLETVGQEVMADRIFGNLYGDGEEDVEV